MRCDCVVLVSHYILFSKVTVTWYHPSLLGTPSCTASSRAGWTKSFQQLLSIIILHISFHEVSITGRWTELTPSYKFAHTPILPAHDFQWESNTKCLDLEFSALYTWPCTLSLHLKVWSCIIISQVHFFEMVWLSLHFQGHKTEYLFKVYNMRLTVWL